MMQDKIFEIPPTDWPELRDIYLPEWPKNIYAYNLLDNYLNWIKRDPKIKNLKVYSLNGDWRDGTFVVIDRYQIFINTLEESQERLRILLDLIDWSKGFQVHAVLKRYRPMIMEMIQQKNLVVELEFKTYMQYLPKEEAEHFDETPPEDIVLKPMTTLEHAIQANKAWLFHDEGSLFFIKRMMEWNANIGAFNEKGELVAWCFR
jgi:sRNA-binding regulator protein Hfq